MGLSGIGRVTDVPGQRFRRTLAITASVVTAGSLVLAGPAPAVAAAGDERAADVRAPTTPEVEQLGDPPQAGEPVTLRLTSSDADSGLKGFWYGIEEEVQRKFEAAPAPVGVVGTAEITFTVPGDGGRIFVYVWSEDNAGNTSNRATFDFFVSPVEEDPPEATPIARWPLIGHTNDVVGDHHLTLAGIEGVDYDWVEDLGCRPMSALWLTGSGQAYAETTGAVVTTDSSFSVAAWVMLDSLADDHQTVLSQGGRIRPAMFMQATPEGSWRFAVPNRNPRYPGPGAAATEPGSVPVGQWTHLAGVYDHQGEVRLYVNGELAATGDAGASPWPAIGPFYVGVAGIARGTTSQPVHGAIDSVSAWSSTLHPDHIRAMGTGGGMGPCF